MPGELPADVLATDAGLTELPAAAAAASAAGESPDGFAGTPVHGPPGGPVDGEAVDAPAATVVVDEDLVAELLAGSPADADVEEPVEVVGVEAVLVEDESSAGEPGATDLGIDDPTDTQLAAPELGIDEPTMTIARGDLADDEETGTRIPMPTFSEAPTMEIPAVTDDLRAVRGIGPSMERLLHGLGIISYRQLAMLDGVELERVRAELSDFRTRIERENWVGQARDLHKEKYGRDPG